MRAIALDVGTKRIGVAITDPLGIFAQPLMVIERKGMGSDCALIFRLVRDNEATHLIFGIPYNDDGEPILQAKGIFELKDKVTHLLKQKKLEVMIETTDETMTTHEAHEEMKNAGIKHSQRKSVIDKIAAVMILRSWMEGGKGD